MWIAVAVVAYPFVFRLVGVDYGAYAPGVVALTLLRKAGYGEWTVAALSSVVFALMHTANAIGTGFTPALLLTIPYTFCFGICIYLIMRVTGNLAIVAMGIVGLLVIRGRARPAA